MIKSGMVGNTIYKIVRRLLGKNSTVISMISAEVIIYSGKVKISSQMLDKAPRIKASERDLASLAWVSRPFAHFLEMNSLVPGPGRK